MRISSINNVAFKGYEYKPTPKQIEQMRVDAKILEKELGDKNSFVEMVAKHHCIKMRSAQIVEAKERHARFHKEIQQLKTAKEIKIMARQAVDSYETALSEKQSELKSLEKEVAVMRACPESHIAVNYERISRGAVNGLYEDILGWTQGVRGAKLHKDV